jgi:hypothetical protein
MYSLWAVGPFFEQLWGRIRFLILYLIAGLGGSCAMVISNVHKHHAGYLGAGASGALWGILAAHLVWVVANRRYLPGPMASQMLRQVVTVFVINVGISALPVISAAAHFGGGAVGAVTAVLLLGNRYGGPVLRRLAFLGLVAFPVLCVGAVVVAERLDPPWQQLRLGHLYDAHRDAEQILDRRLGPLLRQKLKVYSLQQVQDAVGDLSKTRAVLSDALAQLRGAGPFPDEEVEAEREKYIRRLEAENHAYAAMELDHFVLPLIADARRRTIQAYQEQWPVLQGTEEGQRTPEVVEQLLAPCVKARQQLEAAIDVLRQVGPYQDPKLERVRVNTISEEEQRVQGWKDTDRRWRKAS